MIFCLLSALTPYRSVLFKVYLVPQFFSHLYAFLLLLEILLHKLVPNHCAAVLSTILKKMAVTCFVQALVMVLLAVHLIINESVISIK